jgi:hypothetical protein
MQADPPMPYGEDPAVQRQQLSPAHSIFYLPSSQAQADQLPPGNNAVLSFGQIPDCGRRFMGRRNVFYM